MSRPDLDSVSALTPTRDVAEVRLQAAERGAEDMLVAVVDGVVGAVSVRWQHGCDTPNPWLYGLAVLAPARRHGIGRALVAAAEAACTARGVHTISLDVDTDNLGAIAFYRKLGYESVRPHEHRWRSFDPRTGAVTGEGTASTWIMRADLGRRAVTSSRRP
ncbi:GNAT family N-acetyltransferase [Phytohabitans rumicis]|uniref:GNAT family N-acetyltransferase n=1 Tax=Phytohabitans rumicis TaxID=1076125 RepID=UPI001C498FB7|nr:GNAT family N-acetyltransferase [Phytohabitans rumicis]